MPTPALNHSGSPQITISRRQNRGYSGMPIPARASHLICWRWVRSARRYRSTSETAQAAMSKSSTTNATSAISSHQPGGGPNGRARSASGARNGSSTSAPSTWVTTAAITIVPGTQRQRGDGTRPSGKCSSSNPKVVEDPPRVLGGDGNQPRPPAGVVGRRQPLQPDLLGDHVGDRKRQQPQQHADRRTLAAPGHQHRQPGGRRHDRHTQGEGQPRRAVRLGGQEGDRGDQMEGGQHRAPDGGAASPGMSAL